MPKRGESKIIPPARLVELRRMKELIRKSPGVREDVVCDLRTRILGGVYAVDAGEVADKIIQHGIYILGFPRGDGCCPV